MDQYKSLKHDMLMIKSKKKAHGGNPWTPLEIKGVTSSRHPSAEVMAERLVQIESGGCFPEVRKAIQSKQFLEQKKRGGQNLTNLQSIQNKKEKVNT